MNRKGKAQFPWLAVVLIALVSIFVFDFPAGIADKITGVFSADEPRELKYEEDIEGKIPCPVEDVSVTLRAYEKDNPSTSATGNLAYFQVYVNDMELSDTDGSFTASPGDMLTIYVAANATQGSADYNTFKDELELGCVGTFVKEYAVPAVAVATIAFYNEDGDKIVAATAGTHQDVDVNEEISACDMKISGVYEDYFSPYGPMVAVMKFYETHFDDVKITSCNAGRDVKAISVPRNMTSETGYAFSAYEIGPTGTMSSEEIRCDLLLDAGATNPDGATANVSVTLMDSDYYKTLNTNVMVMGVEEPENRGSVGAADVTGVLVVSDD